MSQRSRLLLAGLAGLAVGTAVAGGAYLLRRRIGSRSPLRAQERLEAAVVTALRSDDVAGRCAIDVAGLGPGMIELSGRVPNQEAADRAAETAQRVLGVHTVVNRLSVERVELHLEETRRRYGAGDPALRAGGWEGMRSGMGARRQSTATDPARPDDSAHLKEEAIGLGEDTA